MGTTTVFQNGRSQAVRIPKQYRFDADEVTINKIGDTVLLTPKDSKWASFLLGLDLFTNDFIDERPSQGTQVRDAL